MSLSDVTAPSILCCWTNKANDFHCDFLSLVIEICFCFLKHRSETGGWILPQSPSFTVWMSPILVLCSLQEFWPYLPLNIWIPIEIRIWHITYGWYNKMNSLSFLWANNTLSQSQSKSNCRVTNKSKSWLAKLSSFALILNSLGVIGVSHH